MVKKFNLRAALISASLACIYGNAWAADEAKPEVKPPPPPKVEVIPYGIFDAGVAIQNNKAAKPTSAAGATAVSIGSGVWQGSRLGLKGSLVLGGDFSGIFDAAGNINIANGTSGTATTPARILERHAFVGVSSKSIGTLTFGRMPSMIAEAAFATDPLRANNGANNPNVRHGYLGGPGGTLVNNGIPVFGTSTNNGGLDRQDNTVKYTYKNYGLIGSLAYSLGGAAGDRQRNSAMGALIGYDGYGFTFRAGINEFFDGQSANKDSKNSNLVAGFVGASYKIGMVKVVGTLAENTANSGYLYKNMKTDVWSLGTVLTPTPELTLSIAYYGARRTMDNAAGQLLHKFFFVPEYSLGKGFLVYAIFEYANFPNKEGAALDTGAGLRPGASNTAYGAAGLTFAF